MASQRLIRHALLMVIFLFGFFMVSYLSFYKSMETAGSCGHTNSWCFWPSVDGISDGIVHDTQLLVHGPPGVASEIRPPCPGRVSNDDADRDICRPLLRGNFSSTTRPVWKVISATKYIQRVSNCDCFRSDLGYFVSPEDITDDEQRFPIAFSVLTYENLEQTERLLRLIYRPHNVYCIHVDEKSPAELHEGLEAIANCLHNVFIAKPPIDIYWGSIAVVHAEILCMRQLLDVHKRWKYFINLVGRDFPLRTNYEMVKILQAYDGANDVAAAHSTAR